MTSTINTFKRWGLGPLAYPQRTPPPGPAVNVEEVSCGSGFLRLCCRQLVQITLLGVGWWDHGQMELPVFAGISGTFFFFFLFFFHFISFYLSTAYHFPFSRRGRPPPPLEAKRGGRPPYGGEEKGRLNNEIVHLNFQIKWKWFKSRVIRGRSHHTSWAIKDRRIIFKLSSGGPKPPNEWCNPTSLPPSPRG